MASYAVAEERGLPHVQVNIGTDRFCRTIVELLEEPLSELGCARGTAGLLAAPRWTMLPLPFDVSADSTTHSPHRFREPPRVGAPARALPPWWGDRTDPLVYVTFGTVAAGLGLFPAFYRRVVDAFTELPTRVLLTLGQAGAPEALGALPDNVHVERWWPQRELMPHVAAVVGHGGFGTTMLALAAGIPQVVVPLFSADQFDNATRVEAVGVGVAVCDPGAADLLTSAVLPNGPSAIDTLASAVLRILHDTDLRQRAHELATEVAALPPAADAVLALENLVTTAR